MKIKKNNLLIYISLVLLGMFVFKSELITWFYPDREVTLKVEKINMSHLESEKIINQIITELEPLNDKMQLLDTDIKFNKNGKITFIIVNFIYKKEIFNETRTFFSSIQIKYNKHLVLLSSIVDEDSDFNQLPPEQLPLDLKDGLRGMNKIPWNDFFTKYTIEKPDYYQIESVRYVQTSEIETDDKHSNFVATTKGVEKITDTQNPGIDSICYSIIPMYAYGNQFKNESQFEGRNFMNWYIDYELLK